MKKLLALMLATSLSFAVLAGCTPTETTTETDTTTPSTTEGTTTETGTGNGSLPAVTDGSQMIINLTSEPPEMFHTKSTTSGSFNVMRHTLGTLTALDENDAPVPGMAESWEYDEATLTYTFKIREGQTWSTGDALTAEDYAYAFKTLIDPRFGAPYANMGYMIKNAEAINTAGADLVTPTEETSEEDRAQYVLDLDAAVEAAMAETPLGVEVVDDYTLKVTLERPLTYALDMLAFGVFNPLDEALYLEYGADYGKNVETTPSCGPFTMTEWVHESEIVLTKNENWYDAANVALDSIKFVMISDSNTSLNALRAGEIHSASVNADQTAQLRGEGVEVDSFSDGSAWYFEYNTTVPGLSNAKVREALTKAIDVDMFINQVIKNDSTVATSFTPPAISGGTFEALANGLIERDITGAKALLEEGLAEEGIALADFKPVYITDDTTAAQTYAAFMQQQFKANLGIDVTVEPMTYKNRIERMQNRDFDIVMSGWGPDYNDPMTFLDLFTSTNGNNHTGYANPVYDQLILDAVNEADPEARTQILLEVEKLIATDYPVGPIYARSLNYVVNGFEGGYRTALQDMNFIYAQPVA